MNERTTERVAYDGGAGRGEDAGADGGPDAEGGEVPLVERPFEPGVFGLGDQVGDRLAGEDLVHQRMGQRVERVRVTMATPGTMRPTESRAGVNL